MKNHSKSGIEIQAGSKDLHAEHEGKRNRSKVLEVGAYDRQILRSLRRIVRAIDLYSVELKAKCGLTVPQLVCLSTIVREKEITAVDLALQVHLSPSTLVGIMDRLERAGLIRRERSVVDRRELIIRSTASGIDAIKKAPSPLQDNLVHGLARLSPDDLGTIAKSLDTIVELMEAHDLKVAPLLTLESKSYAASSHTSGKNSKSSTRKSR